MLRRESTHSYPRNGTPLYWPHITERGTVKSDCTDLYSRGTPEAQLEYRQQHLRERSLPELRGLQDMKHTHNSFVSFFKHGIEVMAQHGAADIRMTIRAEGLPDPRRYNTPTAPKIVVIMPGDGYTEHKSSRDIILHARNDCGRMIQNISETNSSYDPLHYVILLPRGE